MESSNSRGSTPRPSRASFRSDMSDVSPAFDVSSSFATMASQEDWGISKKMSFRDPLASTSSSVPGSPDTLSSAASKNLSATKAPPSSAEESSPKVLFQIGDNLKKLIAESEVLQTLSSKCIEKTRQLFDEATVRQMREEIYLVLPDRAKEAHDELLHAYTTGGIAGLVELACQMSIPVVRQLAQKLVDWCKWLADHREELAGALAGVYETARAAILQLQYRLMTELWRNLHTLNLNTTMPQRPLASSSVCPGGDYRSPPFIFHAASSMGSPLFQPSQSPYVAVHPYECYTSNSNLSTRSASPQQLHLPGKENDGSRAVPAAGFSLFRPLASGERYTGGGGDDRNPTAFQSGVYAAIAPISSQQKFFEARGDGDAAIVAAVSSGLATPIATYRGMPPCLECGQSLLPSGSGRGSLAASQLVPVQGLSNHTLVSKSGGVPPLFGFAGGATKTNGPKMFEKGGAASGFLASRTTEQLVVFSVSTS